MYSLLLFNMLSKIYGSKGDYMKIDAKIDVLTGKEKIHRINFRIGGALYKAIKIYLYETHQVGHLSEILRDLIFNYIQAEKGNKFMINPLWQKEQEKLKKEQDLMETLKITDSLEAKLDELKALELPETLTEHQINYPAMAGLIIHKKYRIFTKKENSDTWTCRICEKRDIGNRGLHLHKCWKKVSEK